MRLASVRLGPAQGVAAKAVGEVAVPSVPPLLARNFPVRLFWNEYPPATAVIVQLSAVVDYETVPLFPSVM